MEQAIALLKTTRPTFYRWLRAGKVKGMKVGRQWRFYRRDVEAFMKGQEPRIELTADINPLLATLRQRLIEAEVKDFVPRQQDPAGQSADLTIRLAVAWRASDVHIEPQVDARGEPVAILRFRTDGVLHEIARFDARLLGAVIERWKRLAGCDVREKFKPQDGRILLTEPGHTGGAGLDLRACFLPACMGESVTVRFLSREDVRLTLDRIGYRAADRARIERALASPHGLLLAAGPTGSGKTTVLYAWLCHLASPERKILTLEDPVEYLLPGTMQVQINPAAGLTFHSAMRAALRSAPNVIMVGEVRDLQMLEICFQMSLTGHLVITTLHTEEAAGALRRMVDMGAEPFLVGATVRMVSAQRLVRQLCGDCAADDSPPGELLSQAERIARAGGVNWEGLEKNFRRPAGCPRCNGQGFRGRMILCETLVMSGEIDSSLRRGEPVEQLRTIAVSEGMTTLAADGIARAAAAQTTLDEVLRVLGPK